MKEFGPKILDVNGEPVFVVLRYDEYQRLLALASAPSVAAEMTPSEEHQPLPNLDGLTTASTDLAELLPPSVFLPPHVPANGLIPHEVIEGAVHNHWSLTRAWREYLGITQLTMAQRLGVSVNSYEIMEFEFARLSQSSLERLAAGLGIGLEQLVTRPRRLRRKDYT